MMLLMFAWRNLHAGITARCAQGNPASHLFCRNSGGENSKLVYSCTKNSGRNL